MLVCTFFPTQASAHSQLRSGAVDVCRYLEDFVHECGDVMRGCMRFDSIE